MNNIITQKLLFLEHCTINKRLSAKTIKCYGTDLDGFNSTIDTESSQSLEISRISKTEIQFYINEISHFKPKTIKRKIATLKTFFNYLEFENKIQNNPFKKIKLSIKEPKLLPKILSLQETQKIIRYFYKDLISARNDTFKQYDKLKNYIIIELLFQLGVRISELLNIKVTELDLENGVVTINGKGSKQRVLQICENDTIKSLKKLIQNKHRRNSQYVFINRFGNKCSDQSVRNFINNCISKIGINRKITPHVFRHTFATVLLENDVDIKYIQGLLGHSSINTTQIYTHVSQKKQNEILKTKHPRKKFVLY